MKLLCKLGFHKWQLAKVFDYEQVHLDSKNRKFKERPVGIEGHECASCSKRKIIDVGLAWHNTPSNRAPSGTYEEALAWEKELLNERIRTGFAQVLRTYGLTDAQIYDVVRRVVALAEETKA